MNDKLKKNEIAKILGINRSTIRYYEQVGLIKPEVDDNNYRGYGIEELKLLSRISFLRSIDLDIETIGHVLHDESEDTGSILVDKKKELMDLIKLCKSNIKKIDEIISYSSSSRSSRSEPMNYEIMVLQKRYLYRIESSESNWGELYKGNEAFFKDNTISLGDWFIQTLDARSLLNEGNADFIECLEVREKMDNQSVLIPKGTYACYEVVFEEDDEVDWNVIADNINKTLVENQLEIRDGKILFINKDNMNFNFSDSRRVLVVQVTVK